MILKNYMKLVESSLYEGGKGSNVYDDMFREYMTDNKLYSTIKKNISWAKQTLKKTDRIVWFLRWYRIYIVQMLEDTNKAISMSGNLSKPISISHKDNYAPLNPAKTENKTNIEIQKLNKKTGRNFYINDMIKNLSSFQIELQHFLSLPIQQIQEIKWTTQSPNELISEFKEYENEWKESSNTRNQIKYNAGNEPTKIIDFYNGFAWFDLEKSYCDQESQSMGHCGNSGGRGTIFSLRKFVANSDGKTIWYPVLTFISHDGVLGEMKGRGNDKPSERYHSYIVALLKSDYVEGIKGGGYKPENNFKMSDLSDDEREELIKLKPDLGELSDMYEKEGMTPRVLNRLESALDSLYLPTDSLRYIKDENEFIVEEWKDFESFIRNGVYDDDCQKILKIALGEEEWQEEISTTNINMLFSNTIEQLPDYWKTKIINHYNDEYFYMFKNVLTDMERVKEGVKEEAWKRLYQYACIGWGYKSYHVYDNIPSKYKDVGDDIDENELKEFKKFVTNNDNVYLKLTVNDILRYADDDDDDDDTDYSRWDLTDGNGGYDWATIDYENLNERRREAGLYDNRNNDTLLSGKTTDDSSLVEKYISVLNGNTLGNKIEDPNQNEINFEESLKRMKKLSRI